MRTRDTISVGCAGFRTLCGDMISNLQLLTWSWEWLTIPPGVPLGDAPTPA